MKGLDIVRDLKMRSDTQQYFIKWWRKENDFADYELIDTFVHSGIDDLDFGGYELLNMEQMWDLVRSYAADHVDLAQKGGEKLLVWRHADGTSESRTFSPETLMEIFDAETRGDVLM